MDDFVSAWTKGVYRLRLEHGFKIERAGAIKESNQFVWILSYDGPEDWRDKEAQYYDSAERHALDPDPRQWIARGEQYFISQVIPPP
jgi:hypothetical protein